MSIPPISPISPQYQPSGEDPKLKQLYNLWNDWWHNPSAKSGNDLLQFLQKNESYFENLAKGKQPPAGFPRGTSFEHYYQAAISSLNTWLHAGHCNPNLMDPPSEFIADVYTWAKE